MNLDNALDSEAQEYLELFIGKTLSDSTLGRLEQDISHDLHDFLKQMIPPAETQLSEIEEAFNVFRVPEDACPVSDVTDDILHKVVPYSVNVSSAKYIGHMTSALPNFVLPFSKLMVGLNQNVVKIETSKSFTAIERQVLRMMHHLVFTKDEMFYQRWMHDPECVLGNICSGGTVANITALWVARNKMLKPAGEFGGVIKEGLYAAMQYYGYKDLALMVSERGHYSLEKAADILGIGKSNIYKIPVDENNRVMTGLVWEKCQQLQDRGVGLLGIVGIAGTTETGSIDPLADLADIAETFGCHFHVDAAWGGATLFSNKYRQLMDGIERADSVTIDAHKQMYLPIGSGMVLFKNPTSALSIQHQAEYIIRRGSKDLGRHHLEGSRPGVALLMHAGMHILGRKGYEFLINQSIQKAKAFAALVRRAQDFELISKPELCLLTYRYVPQAIQCFLHDLDSAQQAVVNALLDKLTISIQGRQFHSGKSFVSRTRINHPQYPEQKIIVFRVVLANPLTTEPHLQEILEEQESLTADEQILVSEILSYMENSHPNSTSSYAMEWKPGHGISDISEIRKSD